MSLSPRVLGGAVLAGAVLLAWQDERARGTSTYYTPDGELKEDWALVPLGQRAIIGARAGWSGILMDGNAPLPVTSCTDAERITRYWDGRLKAADQAAQNPTTGAEDDAISAGRGPRVSAFRSRIYHAKRAQGAPGGLAMYAERAWTDLAGPLNPEALVLFWGAVASAAHTVHATLSQLSRDDTLAMYREIGSDFTGTLGELLGKGGGFLAELAAGAGVSFLVGVLSHPLVLGAAGLWAVLYFRGSGSGSSGGTSQGAGA